ALAGLVAAELEHVLARDLRGVGREVARLLALIMVRAGAEVRLDRQVAAAAARRPAQVAGEAGHLFGRMGELGLRHARAKRVAAGFRAGARDQLGAGRALVEAGAGLALAELAAGRQRRVDRV